MSVKPDNAGAEPLLANPVGTQMDRLRARLRPLSAR